MAINELAEYYSPLFSKIGSFTIKIPRDEYDHYDEFPGQYFWEIYDKGHSAYFKGYLTELPGCCGVVVSNGVTLKGLTNLNKGIYTLLDNFIQDLAWELGYTILLYTANKTSFIHKTENWTKFNTFTNRTTENTVEMFYLDLSPPVYDDDE